MTSSRIITLAGWIMVIIFCAVGIIFSVNQIPPDPDSYNPGFAEYPAITLLHVIPGILFMILGPLQFIKSIRNRFISFHRWSGRIFMACTLIAALTAIILGTIIPYGGIWEQLATYIFGAGILYSLYRAYKHVKNKEIDAHRRWVIRVFAIGLGISMIRLHIFLLTFFMDYTQLEVFPLTFWTGFSSSWLIGEFWIHFSKKNSKPIIHNS